MHAGADVHSEVGSAYLQVLDNYDDHLRIRVQISNYHLEKYMMIQRTIDGFRVMVEEPPE